MKTNFKTLRLVAVAFSLFALPFNALADTFELYLCGAGSANLTPDLVAIATLKAGDKLIWQEVNPDDSPVGGASSIDVLTNGVAPLFPVTGLSVGAHYYKVHIISSSANSCSGDASPKFNVYSLPAPGVSIAAPTQAFCIGGSNPALTSSIITATATALDPKLTDVTYEFTWTGTKGGTALSPVTSVGTIAPITTVNENTFTLDNTAGVGNYIFKASVKYLILPNKGTLKGDTGTGCTAESAATPTITVTPKPATPTIIIG
ncbi:hypothetical protein [Pedobacter gandavensis]|uniref:hypothetical protein n=1 Tax=Pedobacter gandavensis TaxID=2679963 RepID=UPI002930C44E|nr:hypothetical protein [Pedobacter gandavensis]